MEASTAKKPKADTPPPPPPEPAKTVTPATYRIGIDAATVTAVVEWASENADDFSDANDPFPADVVSGDVITLGEQSGVTREKAVDSLLDKGSSKPTGDTMAKRLKVVQSADNAGVELLFVTVPVSKIGEVPVKTEVERNRKVGKR